MVSEEHWMDVWNTSLNHHTTINNYALVLGDTSNEKGEYLSPDLKWLAEKLEEYKKKKAILLSLHIAQANGRKIDKKIQTHLITLLLLQMD